MTRIDYILEKQYVGITPEGHRVYRDPTLKPGEAERLIYGTGKEVEAGTKYYMKGGSRMHDHLVQQYPENTKHSNPEKLVHVGMAEDGNHIWSDGKHWKKYRNGVFYELSHDEKFVLAKNMHHPHTHSRSSPATGFTPQILLHHPHSHNHSRSIPATSFTPHQLLTHYLHSLQAPTSAPNPQFLKRIPSLSTSLSTSPFPTSY